MTPRWLPPAVGTAFIAFMLALILVTLTGCGPKNQPCRRPGDLKVSGGVSYVCKAGPSGNTWQ